MNDLSKKWDFVRIVRLLTGLAFAIYAFTAAEYTFLFVAGYFLLQAILNISCCGVSGCSSQQSSSDKRVYDGVIQEYDPKKK